MSRATIVAFSFFWGAVAFLGAEDRPPLHDQIDVLLAASPGPKAAVADDATFARRASLDVIGRIPTREELSEFLASDVENKRGRFVDQLLASAEYAEHFATVFDVMLMERRANKHVKADEFRRYLRDALSANRSYRDIVVEILAADGTDAAVRPAAAFYLEREVEPHLLTRDVGRVFFGVDLQCAQCHDHPLIDDYHQADYYGLNAFFVRSSLFQPDKKKPALVSETATGEADFKSVFTEREGRLGPKMPGGVEMLEVSLKPTDQYTVAPAKNVRPIPKFSRRSQLAKLLRDNTPRQFDKNIANRLWAHLLGRGLVDPVDLLHSENPPTHPELLDLLADHFAASNYDIKLFVREIMLSQTYQRDFRLPSLDVEITEAASQIDAARKAAEEANAKLVDAQSRLDLAITRLDEAMAQTKPFRDAEAAANKAVAEAVKKRDAAKSTAEKTEAILTKQQNEAKLLATSAAATKAAVEALKEDKDLADALATIQKRIAVHTEAQAKTEATLTSQREALAGTESKLDAASAEADKAIADRVGPEKLVVERRAEMFATRVTVQELRLQSSLAHQQVAYWESLIEYDRLNRDEVRLLAAVEKNSERVDQQKSVVEKAVAAVAQAESLRGASEKVLAASSKAKAEADSAFADAQEVAANLTESIDRAEGVRSKIENDESLAEAIQLLATSLAKAEAVVAKRDKVRTNTATDHKAAKNASAKALSDWNEATKAATASRQKAAELAANLQATNAELEAVRQQQATATDNLIKQFAACGHIRELTALNPEQLAYSMLVATDYIDRLKTSANAQADKRLTKLDADHEKAVATAKKDGKPEPAKVSRPSRESLVAEEFAKSIAAINKRFVDLYGAEPGQPQSSFFATADQSLFVANGSELRSWLTPSKDNLTARLLGEEDHAKLSKDLYSSVLSRAPTTAEISDVSRYLSARPEQKREAVQELAWGLLTSAEFRFQH